MGRPLVAGPFPQVNIDCKETTTSKLFVSGRFFMALGHGVAWFKPRNKNEMEEMSELVPKMRFWNTRGSLNSRFCTYGEFQWAARTGKVETCAVLAREENFGMDSVLTAPRKERYREEEASIANENL